MSERYYRVLRKDGTEFNPRFVCGFIGCNDRLGLQDDPDLECDGNHTDPTRPYPGYKDLSEYGIEVIKRDREELTDFLASLWMEDLCKYVNVPVNIWEVESDQEPAIDIHGCLWLKDGRYLRTVNHLLRSPELLNERLSSRARYAWEGTPADSGLGKHLHSLDVLWFPHHQGPDSSSLHEWLAENPCCANCPRIDESGRPTEQPMPSPKSEDVGYERLLRGYASESNEPW